MKISKEILVNELDLPYGAIEDTLVDNSRWSIGHRIIFQYNDKFYEAYYSEGATEMQCERPWEYNDEVECTEVIKKKITVDAWVPLKNK